MNAVWTLSYVVLWVFVIVLAVMVILLYRQLGEMYLGASESRTRDGLAIGARIPGFIASDDRGGRLALPSDRRSLVVFGSPTCGPCLQLMPHLVNFARQLRDLDVIFISSGDEGANRRLAADHETPFPIVTQPDTSLADRYGVRVTPFAFYVDANGTVRAKGVVNRLSQLQAMVLRGDREPSQGPPRATEARATLEER